MTMNFTENFEQFASKLSSLDLALYAGLGLIIWVIFKDKLNPIQKIVLDLLNKVKGFIGYKSNNAPTTTVVPSTTDQDLFFSLVGSWKQTRDLAVKSGCKEAVKVADQMFPYLSPTVCNPSTKESTL